MQFYYLFFMIILWSDFLHMKITDVLAGNISGKKASSEII